MKPNNLDYIDFKEVNKLLEGFNKSTGFVTAILDLKGNVLSKSGWRQICTEFHRINHETSKNCTISDTILASKLAKNEKYHFYECLNGLVDVAVPIFINGEHVANLFSGQFFFKKPEREFFIKQAGKYGFDEQKYLKALDDVPVVSKKKVKVAMDFLLNMTQLISEITLQKLEQSQLNEALRKSEERSRSALDHMLEGCQIIGFDWKYIYLNSTAEMHNRRPNEELTGKRYMDMWPGIEKTTVFQIIKQTLEERSASHFENEFTYPDGSRAWFDLSIQPVPEGVFILSIDITERRLREEQLYESEFRFNRLYENGPFGMVMADKEFRFKNANPAFCNIIGYDEAEIRKLTFKEITHPDDRAKDLINVQKLMNKELAVYKTEKRYIRKDGKVIWGSLTVTATFDSEGHFLYNLGIIEDITERRLAAEALQESGIRLELALNSSHSGVWDWDVSTNKIIWSAQMFELFGADKNIAEASFDTWRAALHPDDKEQAELKIAETLKNHTSLQNNYRVILPDGKIRWINATGEGFYDTNGQPLRMIGICKDITEQKLADEKVREKDQEFRKLSANVPDLIYQFTRRPDGTYFVPIASEGIRNIFGCTPEDVLDDFTPISRVIYKEDVERVIHDIEYSAEHLSHFTCEFRVQITGREIQWIYSNSTPERLPDGSVTWYGFNVDITPKKLAEEALKEKSSRLDLAMQTANMAWWEMDSSTGKVTFYKSKATILGYPPENFTHYTDFTALIHPDDLDKAMNAMKMHLSGLSDKYEVEYRIMKSSGEYIWFYDIGAIVKKDSTSAPLNVIGFVVDINARKIAEDEIRKLNETLEERIKERTKQLSDSNRELESFAYSVSHDLRAPLRHVIGFSEKLESVLKASNDPEVNRLTGKIKGSASRMSRLIDELLTYSRLGRTDLKTVNLSLNSIIDEIVREEIVISQDRKIEWKISQLPNVSADPTLIRLVLQNLIHNSIKFTGKKKDAVIEIYYEEKNKKEYTFCIKDNGAGFNNQYTGKLFGVFQRLHTTEEFEGTGIGLATVRRIINKHNGSVWAEGKENEGASFYFTLPK